MEGRQCPQPCVFLLCFLIIVMVTTVAFQESYNSEIEAFIHFLFKSHMSLNSVEWDDGQKF